MDEAERPAVPKTPEKRETEQKMRELRELKVRIRDLRKVARPIIELRRELELRAEDLSIELGVPVPARKTERTRS